ncbi:MAG: hypothetical protein ACKVU1_14905 [bacterium]
MEVRYACAKCRAPAAVPIGRAVTEHRCAACGDVAPLRFSESLLEKGVADRCALCTSEHFYIQKDFDQRIGCLVVAIGAVFVPWTYGLSLGVCALIDWFLYMRLPNVAKCYICKATYVGGTMNAEHTGFDLHMLEKYEAEARRKG